MNFPFPNKNKLSKEEIAEMLKMSPEHMNLLKMLTNPLA